MTETMFQQLKQQKDSFLYHSFEYVAYEEVQNYDVVYEDGNLILIRGVHPTLGISHIHFFTNTYDRFIQGITPYVDTLIEFVPKAWVHPLQKAGFTPYAEFRDYWVKEVQSLTDVVDYEVATIKDTEEIIQLTESRKGSSRAFHGEKKEFIINWILQQSEGVEDSNILVIKKNSIIRGALFVGLYGSHEKRTVWVRMVVVDHDFEGQGIGQTLLKQALYYGKQRHAIRAFLMADDLNHNAIHVYKKIGFKPDLTTEQINMITKK